MVKNAPIEDKIEAAASKLESLKKKAISKADKPDTKAAAEKKKFVVSADGKKVPAEKPKASKKNATAPVFKPAIAPAEKAQNAKAAKESEAKKATPASAKPAKEKAAPKATEVKPVKEKKTAEKKPAEKKVAEKKTAEKKVAEKPAEKKVKAKAIEKKKPEPKEKAKPKPKPAKKDIDSDYEHEEEMDGDRLPGQKFKLPEEGDGVLIYYTSLHEQRPESKMAERWLLEHGYYDVKRADELNKKWLKLIKK